MLENCVATINCCEKITLAGHTRPDDVCLQDFSESLWNACKTTSSQCHAQLTQHCEMEQAKLHHGVVGSSPNKHAHCAEHQAIGHGGA